MHNIYIYILIMALTTYAIRVLPLTLIRKPIKNTFIQSFILCALCYLSGYDISCYHAGNPISHQRNHCFTSWNYCCLERCKSVSGCLALL